MKRIHLLRVDPDSDVVKFRGLIDAVRADGGRVGWLVWRPDETSDGKGPSTTGLLRHVEVDGAGSVSRKQRVGPPGLRDVLREHFRGCRVVLVAGEAVGELAEIAGLTASDDRFRLDAGESVREVSAEELASRLRRPVLS